MKRYQKEHDRLMSVRPRSAWGIGVIKYAVEMLEYLESEYELGREHEIKDRASLLEAVLRGAKNWEQFSRGACALVSNYDIAMRLCNQSELLKTRNGQRAPNVWEDWLAVQSRALDQAYMELARAFGYW